MKYVTDPLEFRERYAGTFWEMEDDFTLEEEDAVKEEGLFLGVADDEGSGEVDLGSSWDVEDGTTSVVVGTSGVAILVATADSVGEGDEEGSGIVVGSAEFVLDGKGCMVSQLFFL